MLSHVCFSILGFERGRDVPLQCRIRWFAPPPNVDAYMWYVSVPLSSHLEGDFTRDQALFELLFNTSSTNIAFTVLSPLPLSFHYPVPPLLSTQ